MILEALTTVLAVLVSSYLIWLVAKRKQKDGEPPIVPFWIPWLGSGLQYQKDPITFLRKQEKKYGPIFTVFMGGSYFTFVTDPFTHPIIAKEGKVLNFRICTIPTIKKVFDFTRRGLDEPTMGGLMVKYLQGHWLETLVSKMMGNLQKVLLHGNYNNTDWATTGLLHLVETVMCTAGFKSLFGEYPASSGINNNKLHHKIVEDFVKFDKAFPLLVQGRPISSLKGVKESRANMWKFFTIDEIHKRELVYEMVEQYAKKLEENQELEELKKELYCVNWAAMSNTLLSAFWALYYILKHPEAMEAANVEIQRMLKETSQCLDRKSEINFTRDDMAKMTVLDSIINETLRLNISSSLLRQALQDYNLKVVSADRSYKIRKGDKLMTLFQLTHYDPEIYEQPDQFKFDRFLNSDGSPKTDFYKKRKIVKFFLQPFGSGVSKCPGRYWAVTELKQLVILLLLYFDFKLINPEQEIKMDQIRVAFGSLPPTVDPQVQFHRRVIV
ncbi:cytochrome P450 7B1-like [Ciona intestinalis]